MEKMEIYTIPSETLLAAFVDVEIAVKEYVHRGCGKQVRTFDNNHPSS
jgi:hypothetical protein